MVDVVFAVTVVEVLGGAGAGADGVDGGEEEEGGGGGEEEGVEHLDCLLGGSETTVTEWL